jgi:uncharacterized protein YlxW (UPF0749 family)
MNVFTSGNRHQPWVWQVTTLCFILGFLLAGSLLTVKNVNRFGGSSRRVGQAPAGAFEKTDAVPMLEKELAKLRDDKTRLERSLSEDGTQAKTLNAELQKTKFLAGITPTRGEGIILVMQDSKKRPPTANALESENFLIHDLDLQRVVNELWATGAEAISVNEQRVIGRTSIRCVGPSIQVNSVPLAPPYEIRAIGDTNALIGGLNLPGGVLTEMRRFDPEMLRLEKKATVDLPAYTGTTDFRFAKPILEKDRTARKENANTEEKAK